MDLYRSGMEAYMSAMGGNRTQKGIPKPRRGGSVTISEEELKTLIYLCHPDKHNGQGAATEMTKKLLDMRGTVK
jgi:hypothetical protein